VLCRLVGDRYSSPLFLRSNAVLLAAGGLGGLYGVTTNPARVRGQAIGMAARAGAVVADAEFVQFHPTAINIGQDPAPLATEALRGEGALLINDSGHRFMLDVHPDAELASRDIVARAIFREIKAGRGAYLDTRQALGKRILSLFPTVAETCLAADIDPVTSPIPVAPAAHYHMGGVKADLNGRTSLEGLWAAGEAASTGLHGANRLASNGLLEALVIASRATADINDSTAVRQRKINRIVLNEKTNIDWTEEQELRRSSAVEELRAVMSQHCGVERSAEGLHSALRQIAALERNADHVSRSFLNMTTAATLVAAAALKREESRGGHFRTDFPETHAMAARSFITLAEAHSIRENAEKAKPNE
jgi:L-aspartate oxidase